MKENYNQDNREEKQQEILNKLEKKTDIILEYIKSKKNEKKA